MPTPCGGDAPANLLLAALPEAPRYAAVVVKGSRFMKTEQVVVALIDRSDASRPKGGEKPHAA